MSSPITMSAFDLMPFCYKASARTDLGRNIREVHASEFRPARDPGFVVHALQARLGCRVSSSRSAQRRIYAAVLRGRGPTRGRRTRMLRPILLPSPSRNVRCGLWSGLQLSRNRCRYVSSVFSRLETGVELSILRTGSSSTRVRVFCSLLFLGSLVALQGRRISRRVLVFEF